MKVVVPLLLALAACGATQQPLLSHAPAPNVGAVAGVAAAAAAAITLASPGAANQKPEDKVNENTRPQQVNESVPSDVLDRLDEQNAGSSNAPGQQNASPAVKKKPAGVRLPSPREAVEQTQPAAADKPAN
ncbi:MAG TPA: hypothetical protein VGL61_05330 [Kofleriaceae bacterium]|jgi:outer membrane receptor protein involved in Fe transport